MSKLYETKVVKLQSYSSIELLYLLQDVLKELMLVDMKPSLPPNAYRWNTTTSPRE